LSFAADDRDVYSEGSILEKYTFPKTTECGSIDKRRAAMHSEMELQSELREQARAIVAEIFAIDPEHGRDILGGFVSELFLTVAKRDISESRRQKQAEGIAAAKARGVRFGPEPRPLPDNFDVCYEAWQSGELSMRRAAKACGMSTSSFKTAAKREGEIPPDGRERDGKKRFEALYREREADPIRHHQGPPLPHAGAGRAI